jgi:hypothetical protein
MNLMPPRELATDPEIAIQDSFFMKFSFPPMQRQKDAIAWALEEALSEVHREVWEDGGQ